MRVPQHLVDRRREELRGLIRRDGFLPVAEICRRQGVSEATARRDLVAIEAGGHITRTRGGALADYNATFASLGERATRARTAKGRIAAAAARLIPDASTVFLDAGTTVLQLARLIRVNPMPLRVFTNGLLIAQEFLNVPNLQVSVLGGQLRSENASFVGPQAEAVLEGLWFDQLFLGVSCIGLDGSIYSADSAEANLNRRMLPRSAQSHVLADSSKFGAMATYKVAPLKAVTQVVTDSGVAPDWRHKLDKLGVTLCVVPIAGEAA